MARFLDARIPVVFNTAAAPGDYALTPEPGWATPHPVACTCCADRGPAAAALDRLFLDRVRGAVPWFGRVVVTGDSASLRHALEADSVIASRFRLVTESER